MGWQKRAGWALVFLWVLVTLVFAVHRLGEVWLTQGGMPVADSFDERYFRPAWLSSLHILPGVLFLVLGPFQFSRRIRGRWVSFHRWCGRIYLLSGLTLGIAGLVMASRLPVFGGLHTFVATCFFGVIFLFSL